MTKEIGYAKVQVLKRKHEPLALVNEKIDPKEFFETREELYVSSSFSENILPKASLNEDALKLQTFELVRDATDDLIELALPEEHIFSESEVCALIIALIKAQKPKEEGVLLNTGYWNLFYTPSFVVDVYRDGGEWFVSAWERDGREWRAGRRVFSPATDIELSETKA